MYAAEFDYVRASSIEEAISLKRANEDSSLLAGGHSLIPAMKLRLSTPQKLIDISGLDQLKNISNNGSYISIGALCTHKQCAESDIIQSNCPALSDAASVIGDPHVRNKGTLGGALAHSDPQADYPGAVLALNATIIVEGSGGERTIEAVDYFTGLWETALGENEILTEVRIPTDRENANSCYLKFPQPASRYPYVGCGVSLSSSSGTCLDIRVGFSGVGEWAFRDSGIESALKGQPLNESTIASAAGKAAEGKAVLSDHFVSEEYRRAMAQVYAKRALTQLS
ncbi:MAG TPA: xanthine dehydrogenase family protein subunit M [Gammaproteobacteria bacterium]|jgi:carbon-monoxide dehydrogenase medium subunit|nr:xanthine dehydrogenase family protein subunit M [Candidatus Lambdaproteobacteria bacterium]HIK97860.1 xanthine dehydrogenase family protein subunit M [Gammaproteobacteria bacterium]